MSRSDWRGVGANAMNGTAVARPMKALSEFFVLAAETLVTSAPATSI